MLVKCVRLASPRQGEDNAWFFEVSRSRLPVSESLNSLPAAANVEVGNDVNMSLFMRSVKRQSSFDFGGTPIASLRLVEKTFTLSMWPHLGQVKISFPGTTMDIARKMMATTSHADAPR